MLLLSLINSCYYHYYHYFTISITYQKTCLFPYLLVSALCYFTYIFCHLLDFSYVYYLLGLFMYLFLFIYIFTYLYIYFLSSRDVVLAYTRFPYKSSPDT